MRRQNSNKSKYPVKSLIKALRILDALANSRLGRGVTEISKELRIGKSTTHRLLATLKDEGYVLDDPLSSRYLLGSKISKLEEQRSEQYPLIVFGRLILERLGRRCYETASLAIFDGRDVLFIAKVESQEPVRVSEQIGKRLPAYSTALGKVFLAAKTEREIRGLYKGLRRFHKFTPNTIDNLNDLVAELEAVRREGIAYDREEMYLGLNCFAVPVRDCSGSVVAGISLSVPKYRVSTKRDVFFKKALLHASSELSEKLGFAPVEGALAH